MLKFARAKRVKKETFQSSGKEFPIKPHSLAHFAIKMTKGHWHGIERKIDEDAEERIIAALTSVLTGGMVPFKANSTQPHMDNMFEEESELDKWHILGKAQLHWPGFRFLQLGSRLYKNNPWKVFSKNPTRMGPNISDLVLTFGFQSHCIIVAVDKSSHIQTATPVKALLLYVGRVRSKGKIYSHPPRFLLLLLFHNATGSPINKWQLDRNRVRSTALHTLRHP